jgi:peptide-methionine (S)-S-oxide reductase
MKSSFTTSFLFMLSVSHVFAFAPSAVKAAPRTPRKMISSILDLLGGPDKSQLIDPEKALPGRSTKMPNIDGLRHYVLGNKLEGKCLLFSFGAIVKTLLVVSFAVFYNETDFYPFENLTILFCFTQNLTDHVSLFSFIKTEVPKGYKEAIFANGCFWGSEKGIWRLPKGIHSTAVGYCAGFTPNPTYEEACSGLTGHTEGVRVVYNPQEVSFVDILRWFWEAHDPTSGMGQGNDRGTQYRSGFYYFDDEQKQLIEASKTAYEKELEAKTGLNREITTEIASVSDFDKYGGCWYFAEPYHQQVSRTFIGTRKA